MGARPGHPGDSAAEIAALAREFARETERLRGDLRTMARRLSHDLRTPLNSVAMAGEALQKSAPGSKPSQSSIVETLQGAVTEAARLLERMSFVLKATADPLPRRPVAMGEVVWAALQRVEKRAAGQGAAIVQPETWPEVEGVASWLEVVWENLIGNSLVHGGRPPRIELGWTRLAGECQFWVRDHGPGIPAGKRERLFTPFELLHELSAPRGLGLPIALRLVELQDGQCAYKPAEGGGACFLFTLPLPAARP
jgi:signal transduction histidine kinase